jgi:uncharacterized protein YyaL (SSP411 family)
MTGRGGWPMTVFLTPAGEPFYGGTYFPAVNFVRLMEAISDAWSNRREELAKNTEALREAISRTAKLRPSVTRPGEAQLDKAIQAAIADGTVRTLAMKWFKLDVSPKS